MDALESGFALGSRLDYTADANSADLEILNNITNQYVGVKTMLRTYFGY